MCWSGSRSRCQSCSSPRRRCCCAASGSWRRLPLGIRTHHTLTAEVNLGNRYQQPAQQAEFFRRLEERIRQVPGVEQLALSDSVPPAGAARSRPFSTLEVFGKEKYAAGTGGMVVWRSVTPDYFHTLSIPIV